MLSPVYYHVHFSLNRPFVTNEHKSFDKSCIQFTEMCSFCSYFPKCTCVCTSGNLNTRQAFARGHYWQNFDTKIFKTIVSQENSSLLQPDLRNLASWSSSIGLALNESECKL